MSDHSSSTLLLVGAPNSGKSLLFNRLTGLQHRVANFPGVTVQVKSGHWQNHLLLDFPGSYSLKPLTKDEDVAVQEFHQALKKNEVALVICVLDATRLERSLSFALSVAQEAQKQNKKVLFLANMMDDLQANGLSLDYQAISKELNIPVHPISAKTKQGLAELSQIVESLLKNPLSTTSLSVNDLVLESRRLSKAYGPQGDVLLKRMNRWDQIFLSSIWGGLFFLLIMLVLFQSIFTWAAPLMDGVEWLVASVGAFVGGFLPEGFFKDFMDGAVFGGFGSFLVFVPQIFILTFIIGLLEDSGYLARVAIICHRPLSFFGLSGKSFIPYLSGHACAIPAIYATRVIESPQKRWVTLLTIPLIACSARLPIYALFIAVLIPPVSYLGGLVHAQGLVFMGLFLLGYVFALLVSGIYSKVIYKTQADAPFVIELPSYRRPLLQPLLLRALRSAWEFLIGAGPVIFVVSVVVWVLGYFPTGELQDSWLSALGHWFEPFVRPLGLDWRFAVAILTSFIAREVFVGTLGTLYGIEGAEEDVTGLADKIRLEGLPLASGLALLIFYVIALQCVSTLATLRRETGSVKTPVYVFIFYTALAYVLAILTYQILV